MSGNCYNCVCDSPNHQRGNTMKTIRIAVMILSLTTVLSCNREKGATGPGLLTRDNVQVTVHNQTLNISNQTGSTIFYAVFPKSLIPLIDWMPCTDPDICPNQVENGKSTTLTYAEVLGGVEDDTVILYWWHLVRKTDGSYHFDNIHPLEITL